MPPALVRLVRRQHGAFSYAQALAAGMSAGQIRVRLARGDWVRVQPRVYAALGAPLSDWGRMWAAWLSIGPGMWFTGVAGALLLGLGPVPSLTTLDVALLRGRGAAGRAGLRLRRCRQPAGTGWRSGLPVLPVVDVLLDCAATIEEAETMALVQEALRSGRCSAQRIHAAMGRGRSGSARMRRVLHVVGDGADSEWERRLITLCRRQGLPPPTRPTLVAPSGRWFRPDLYWPGLVVEVDGWSVHRGSTAFQVDRRRQNELVVELGLAVLRYTPVDIRERPEQVVSQIRGALRRLAS